MKRTTCVLTILTVAVLLGLFGRAESAAIKAKPATLLEPAWQVPVHSSGADFYWTSPFPVAGPGPWTINVEVVSVDISISGGPLGDVLSSLLTFFREQLASSFGSQSYYVASLPATVASGHMEVPYEGQTPFAADVAFTIDAAGYGHYQFTGVQLGNVVVNIPPIGDLTFHLDSFDAILSLTFVPAVDCNGNGRADNIDIQQGTSSDRNLNGVPDECEPDNDLDGVPDDVDNCPSAPNPDQGDSDGDGIGDACEKDWRIPVHSSGEGFSWTSPFPVTGSGPWTIDFSVVSADIGISGGPIGDVISSLLPFYQQQLATVVQKTLGTQSYYIASLPATVVSGHMEVPFEGQTPFAADVAFTIDAAGYGHVQFTGIQLGSIVVNIPPLGNVTIHFDSFTTILSLTFIPAADCNGNGRADNIDIQQGTSSDRNLNGVPDECEPDRDLDGVPDDVDNCLSAPNPDQADGDGDGIGDACEKDWQVPVHSSGEDFSWTSPFPVEGPGPWMIDVSVVDIEITVSGGPGADAISMLLPFYQRQLATAVQETLGTQSHSISGLPSPIVSGHIGVPYGSQTPFAADVSFTIDAAGYGHVQFTGIQLGSIVIDIPPIGNVTIHLESFTADFLVTSATIINYRPVSEAGQDQHVQDVGLVTLSGEASTDADGNYPLKYLWRFLSMPLASKTVLMEAASVLPSFIVDVAGDYLIELIVVDILGKASVPDWVSVRWENTAPVADAGEDRLLNQLNTLVSLDGSRSYDEDQNTIKFSWATLLQPEGSNAKLNDPASATPNFMPDSYGAYRFCLIVTDSLGAVSNIDVVTILLNNERPVARAAAGPAGEVGEAVALDGSSSSDANGDLLAFNWTFVSLPPESLANLQNRTSSAASFVPDVAGTYIVSLVVNDGSQNSEPSTVSVTVKPTLIFEGFYSPVENLPTMNSAKAGSSIPIKWRIVDSHGTPVSDPKSFMSVASHAISCVDQLNVQTNEVEEHYSGESGLQYAGDGYWQFNWKTPKSYAAGCRLMVLTLADGSTHAAFFKFK